MSAREADGPHGVLIVDKPSGPTSHDVVASARRHFRTRRVGHAGTLDPMATGVLVLLFGEATKLCEVAAGADKAYVAELCFGRATDSHDACGKTTASAPGAAPALGDLLAALAVEGQRTSQLPPSVSALKVGGRRAHELSRAGQTPVLAARPIAVRSLELEAWDPPKARLTLHVSKGYYVRALARDVGEALRLPAHLSQLRRVRSGDFTVSEACAWPPAEGANLRPLRLERALSRLLPTYRLTERGVARARRGQSLEPTDFVDDPGACDTTSGTGVCAWVDAEGAPVALGERRGGVFRVRRGFAAGDAAAGVAHSASDDTRATPAQMDANFKR